MTAAAGTSHWADVSLAGRFRTRSGRSRQLLLQMARRPKLEECEAAIGAHELVLPTRCRL